MPSLKELREQLAAQGEGERLPLNRRASNISYASTSSSKHASLTEAAQVLAIDDDAEPTPTIPVAQPPRTRAQSLPVYQAAYHEVASGDIVSHDDRINRDGESLFRFLLEQSKQAPSYWLHCRGQRAERPSDLSADVERGPSPATPDATNLSTDFDFEIEIPALTGQTVQWSLSDHEPALRGKTHPEIMLRSGVRETADEEEIEEYSLWAAERAKRGLPPWAPRIQTWENTDVPDEYLAVKSSQSLREWTEEYCKSPSEWKEFIYEKIIYGWDLRHLENSIHTIIQSTGYDGTITVKFTTHGSKVIVRPDTSTRRRLSKALSSTFPTRSIYAIIILLPITVFLWMLSRSSSDAPSDPNCPPSIPGCPRSSEAPIIPGISLAMLCSLALAVAIFVAIRTALKSSISSWSVVGAAYPMNRWEPLPANSPEARDYFSYPEGSYCDPDHKFVRTPGSVSRMIGVPEEEWFMQWEGVIKKAVTGRLQRFRPVRHVKDLQ